ncbi:x globin isoform X2 [Triplophysa rosa]|nr:x globin isoform X2 [Triplophysa rosa]
METDMEKQLLCARTQLKVQTRSISVKTNSRAAVRMGCAISGSDLTAASGPHERRDADEHHQTPAQLTQHQIHIIKESWKVIQEDIAKVGIIMFVRLFETHPECKDVFFLFRDVEDLERLRTSRELRAHGLRVMSFIEKSVARLDQSDRLQTLALELGRSHYRYNAPPKYYGYVGTEFICAVQPILKEKWTPELEQAWKTLFQYVTHIMKNGYLEEEKNKRNHTVTSTKEGPDKRQTAI